MDVQPGLASRIWFPGSRGKGKPRANEEDQPMIATSLTADAEIRRLRKLGEATHDWCEPTTHPMPPTWRAFAATVLRAICTTVHRAVDRCARSNTAHVPAPEGGVR
jgi:hypothetical protein